MKERNITLDIIKIIAAIGVVFIHTPLEPNMYASDKTATVIFALRFSVPFFIISGGYFYKGKNLNPVYSLLKLYIVLIGLRFLFNVAFYQQLEGAIRQSTYWYFITYSTILILTKNQNKFWLSFLFFISIFWNLMTGHIFQDFAPLTNADFYSGLKVSNNNTLTYLSLFILGIGMRHLPIQKIGRPVAIITLIVTVLLIIGNGFIFHYNQSHIFNFMIAVLLMVIGLNIPIYSNLPLRTIYLDLFVYQILVIPVVGMLVGYVTPSTSFVIYTIVSILSCFACLLVAYIVRLIDNKFLDQAIYTI